MFGRTIVLTSHGVIDRCAPAAIRDEAEARWPQPRLPVSRELALPAPHSSTLDGTMTMRPPRCSEKWPEEADTRPAGKPV